MRRIFRSCITAFTLLLLNSCSTALFSSRGPVSLEQVWATDNTFRTPESVLVDRQSNVLYVSNINETSKDRKDGDGFISIMTPDGNIEQLHWVTGLNDPKGMALFNNVLYVADLDEIVAIATQTGSILGRYRAEKAQFLNDVTVDNNGTVYVSDSDRNRIYMFRNGSVTTLVENTRRNTRPNGLLYDSNRLLVAFSGSGGAKLYDLERREFNDWVEKIPTADGIARVSSNGYMVSNWNGEVYYVDQEGSRWKVLDTKSRNVHAADIAVDDDLQILYVPTFYDNRVVAYRISGAGI